MTSLGFGFCWNFVCKNVENIFLWSGSTACFLLQKVAFLLKPRYCNSKKNHLLRHFKNYLGTFLSSSGSLILTAWQYWALMLLLVLHQNRSPQPYHRPNFSLLNFATLLPLPPIPTSNVRNIQICGCLLVPFSSIYIHFSSFYQLEHVHTDSWKHAYLSHHFHT